MSSWDRDLNKRRIPKQGPLVAEMNPASPLLSPPLVPVGAKNKSRVKNFRQTKSYAAIISSLPLDQRKEILELISRVDAAKTKEGCKVDFLSFVKEMWPAFISGNHHKIMADALQRVERGELKRLIICLPPRHTKSEMASYLFPAWFLGKHPEKKIIQASHTAELAVGFGRKVRNLVGNEDYKRIFPDVGLRQDSKAAGRWNTTHNGDYFAIGVGGAVTGKGADILIIDDPHSEQEAAIATSDASVWDKTYEWYTSGPRQRLQPGGSIVVVATRWAKKDLIGRILDSSIKRDGTDEWEIIELPAILPSGLPLWPEFWPLDQLEKIKAELPASKWNAQYQQDPTSDEGALVKREWWKIWEAREPPPCEYIIQSWDTAFLKTQRADYSACTTWGVFYRDNEDGSRIPNVILLDAFQKRMEFPELKLFAFDHYRKWNPDACIVEAKAAGTPLIFELRQMGIPVSEYTPGRGRDKIARVNAVADLFASGAIWIPEKRWAEEVRDQFAEFPLGDHDDLVDSSTQALLRFRQGGFVRIETDEVPERIYRRKADYY